MRTTLLSRILCSLLCGLSGTAVAQRPLTVDDVLAIETIGTVVTSPTGHHAAITIKRAITSASRFTIDYLDGFERADIWIASDTGRMTRITDGHRDSSGFWAPAWSPDGKSFVALSTRGGDNVRLYSCTASAARPCKRLTTRGVDLAAVMTAGGVRRQGYAWLDARRVIVALLPPGATPTQFNIEVYASSHAPTLWHDAAGGKRATASVISSEGPRSAPAGHTLVVVDVETGKQSTVAESAMRLVAVSPGGGSAVVVIDEGPRPMSPNARPEENPRRLALGIIDLAGGGATRRIAGVIPFTSFETPTILWAPDEHAFVAAGRDSIGGVERRYLVERTGSSANPIMPGYRVQSTLWTADNALAAQARPDTARSTRNDWWIVTTGGARNITASLNVPPSMFATAGQEHFATIAGRIHRLTGSGLSPVELPGIAKTRGIVFPRADVPAPTARLLVQLDDSVRSHMIVDLTGARMSTTPAGAGPDLYARPEATLGRIALWTSVAPSGTHVWRSGVPAPSRLLTLNAHLASVSDGKRTLISYRMAKGDSLRASVILPPGYVEGRRYPVITWVYAGNIYRDTLWMMSRKNLSHMLNVQLFAARGYVVLIPSIPLVAEGAAGDPLVDLAPVVLPAVDRLVELGIADSARIGVAGHSYGGNTTLALLTQTGRFKAAASLAGASNLTSMYGTTDVRRRYAPNANDFYFGPRWSEAGQGRMGTGPWADVQRYVRNSPVFFADRITTPLLLIHGDQDYVPISQAEEMFTALNRLGKPVRFVRYWGEGHIFKSPANLRDVWAQLSEWFDVHLRP